MIFTILYNDYAKLQMFLLEAADVKFTYDFTYEESYIFGSQRTKATKYVNIRIGEDA